MMGTGRKDAKERLTVNDRGRRGCATKRVAELRLTLIAKKAMKKGNAVTRLQKKKKNRREKKKRRLGTNPTPKQPFCGE